jgi:hypothetical protein
MPIITIFLPEDFTEEHSEILSALIAKHLDSFGFDYSIQYEPSGEKDEEDGEEG